MENKQFKIEQLQMEMIHALENNDEELYQQLLLVLRKIEKDVDTDEEQ